jgi:hypothetical protein
MKDRRICLGSRNMAEKYHFAISPLVYYAFIGFLAVLFPRWRSCLYFPGYNLALGWRGWAYPPGSVYVCALGWLLLQGERCVHSVHEWNATLSTTAIGRKRNIYLFYLHQNTNTLWLSIWVFLYCNLPGKQRRNGVYSRYKHKKSTICEMFNSQLLQFQRPQAVTPSNSNYWLFLLLSHYELPYAQCSPSDLESLFDKSHLHMLRRTGHSGFRLQSIVNA